MYTFAVFDTFCMRTFARFTRTLAKWMSSPVSCLIQPQTFCGNQWERRLFKLPRHRHQHQHQHRHGQRIAGLCRKHGERMDLAKATTAPLMHPPMPPPITKLQDDHHHHQRQRNKRIDAMVISLSPLCKQTSQTTTPTTVPTQRP